MNCHLRLLRAPHELAIHWAEWRLPGLLLPRRSRSARQCAVSIVDRDAGSLPPAHPLPPAQWRSDPGREPQGGHAQSVRRPVTLVPPDTAQCRVDHDQRGNSRPGNRHSAQCIASSYAVRSSRRWRCLAAAPSLCAARRVSRFIAVDIVRQAPLVGHELLPVDIPGVGSLQTDRPVRDRHLDGSAD